MKLSADAHDELEAFFREFTRDGSFRLPRITIHSGGFVRWLMNAVGFDAMTLGRRVLVSPLALRQDERGAKLIRGRLLAHEAAHVLQYERAGFVRFLFAYLRDYFSGLRRAGNLSVDARARAYSEIAFERDAREAARAYTAWRELRRKEDLGALDESNSPAARYHSLSE